jgi:hypothetical protein
MSCKEIDILSKKYILFPIHEMYGMVPIFPPACSHPLRKQETIGIWRLYIVRTVVFLHGIPLKIQILLWKKKGTREPTSDIGQTILT